MVGLFNWSASQPATAQREAGPARPQDRRRAVHRPGLLERQPGADSRRRGLRRTAAVRLQHHRRRPDPATVPNSWAPRATSPSALSMWARSAGATPASPAPANWWAATPRNCALPPTSTRGAWKALAAEVSAADREAGVTVAMKEEPGLVRVTLAAPANREVQWYVQLRQAAGACGRFRVLRTAQGIVYVDLRQATSAPQPAGARRGMTPASKASRCASARPSSRRASARMRRRRSCFRSMGSIAGSRSTRA